jgi:hypothetical protein
MFLFEPQLSCRCAKVVRAPPLHQILCITSPECLCQLGLKAKKGQKVKKVTKTK